MNEVPLMCGCSQRPYPHELSVHARLWERPGSYFIFDRDTEDHQAEVEFSSHEFRWPWSLKFAQV
jgi:hypothetical protein